MEDQLASCIKFVGMDLKMNHNLSDFYNNPKMNMKQWNDLFQSQGVLSDRLRSFSMQDLSTYQAEPENTGPAATQPAPAQHRTKPMMRSKSESYKGEWSQADTEETQRIQTYVIKLS